MVDQTVQIDSAGGMPEVEILFGDANVGVCRVFRWDAKKQHPEQIGRTSGGKIQLGAPAADLDGTVFSFEALIQSSRSGPGQPYSIRVIVSQDGQVVPGGAIAENGALNPFGAKSVIGFISCQRS